MLNNSFREHRWTALALCSLMAVLDVSFFDAPSAVSSILLTAAKGHFVKIRITQPGKAADAEERALRPLLGAIGQTLL
ncbi:hypothetical protein [Sorangium sp. So ce1389]|uniref:hypothetical protein n=1 Tax=Sorangium sp. So ce1389 TaxID=3133336 RepID=UPI003F603919